MTNRYYDNTRVSTARNCMRQYYLRHQRDWVRAGKSPALAFGSSWHEAMDIVWGMASGPASNEDVLRAAMFKFNEKWTEEGFPAWDDMTPEESDRLAPRTPGTASEMLFHYIELRRPIIAKWKIISIEQPFAVPLNPDDDELFYIGRFDKVFENEKGQIILGEHKTSSSYKKGGPFRQDYLESWSPNSQVDGYLYAAHLLYGDKVAGIWIDAALVHKTIHNGFKYIPINRRTEMLDSWLYETRFWIKLIEDQKRLPVQQPKFMASWPKNTGACNHFAGCSYRDICKAMANPTERLEPPLGYKEEHWEPFDVLAIDQLGLPPE